MMQPRFDKRVGSSPLTLVEQPRFRAGFDFLRLRAQTGEVDEELAHWWETFSMASDDMRQDMLDEHRRSSGKGQPRRVRKGDADHPEGTAPAGGRTHRVPAPSPAPASQDDAAFDAASDADGEGAEPSSDPAAPARKRRRRRRKPGGGAGGAGADSGGAPAGD